MAGERSRRCLIRVLLQRTESALSYQRFASFRRKGVTPMCQAEIALTVPTAIPDQLPLGYRLGHPGKSELPYLLASGYNHAMLDSPADNRPASQLPHGF